MIRLVELLDNCGATATTGLTTLNGINCPKGSNNGLRNGVSNVAAGGLTMVSAVWRQLSYLCQHPGHHSVLLSLTQPQYYKQALKEMIQVSNNYKIYVTGKLYIFNPSQMTLLQL